MKEDSWMDPGAKAAKLETQLGIVRASESSDESVDASDDSDESSCQDISDDENELSCQVFSDDKTS